MGVCSQHTEGEGSGNGNGGLLFYSKRLILKCMHCKSDEEKHGNKKII